MLTSLCFTYSYGYFNGIAAKHAFTLTPSVSLFVDGESETALDAADVLKIGAQSPGRCWATPVRRA
jgi:hypothetical protein